MTQDLIGTFSALELIWTAIALIGLTYSVVNIGGYIADLQALGGRTNGRRRLTRGDIRREAFRIVYYVIAILAGILAGMQSTRSGTPTAAGLTILTILILMSSIQALQSVLDRLDNRYLMKHGLVARDENGRFTPNDKE